MSKILNENQITAETDLDLQEQCLPKTNNQSVAGQAALSVSYMTRREMFIKLGTTLGASVFFGAYGCDTGPKHKVEIGRQRVDIGRKTIDLGKKEIQMSHLEAELEKALIIKESKAVFVLDASGSMEGEKIDALKKQMDKAVGNLKDKQMFDMIDFDSSIKPWKDSLQPAKEAERKDGQEWVSKLEAEGGTYIFEAIQKAFERKEVEALVIVSDGDPSDGSPDEIRQWVKQHNQGRGIKLHTVAILVDQPLGYKGSEAELFLEGLAKDTGGNFTAIRREEPKPEPEPEQVK